MLNNYARVWTNTEKGKEVQRVVFSKLVDMVNNKGDGKYVWIGDKYLEAKLGKLDVAGETFEGISGNRVQLNSHDAFVYAVDRLEEHGLVKTEYHSRGKDVRIMKKGWERWNTRK